MKRSRSDKKLLGPAAAAMRRRDVFQDGRESTTQITVDKILSDAADMQRFHAPTKTSSTRVLIHTVEELALYRQKLRAEFEEKVRRGYRFLGNWVKYARWEAQQGDYERMRGVLERAVSVHGQSPQLWRDYAELEAAGGHVEHARQVWSRGVTALPAALDLWLKYAIFEQTIGDDQAVRDVFSRWLSGEAPASCAYELFALFEAQRGRRDACSDVLRRYVEATNSPDAWLLYSRTEKDVFADVGRAVRVLQTAMEALPGTLLWGPVECRVPLALTEALTLAGEVAEARALHHRLLRQVQDPAHAHTLSEGALAAYGRFERLHGDSKHYEALARMQARAVYEDQMRKDPSDLDAVLSLYLLLRDEAEHMSRAAQPSSSSSGPQGRLNEEREEEAEEVRERAMAVLRTAVDTPADTPHRMQQRTVLIAEYARRLEEAGRLEESRQVLADTIKRFPFEDASCPRLWMEAVELEARHGNYTQARKLLSAAAHITKDAAIFDAALRLEGQALAAAAATSRVGSGADTEEDAHAVYVTQVRQLYTSAIKAFSTDEQRWFAFAKFEEKEGQVARAKAILTAGIRTLTAEAGTTESFTHRYTLLGQVDAGWARLIALQLRLLRRTAAESPGAEAAEAELYEVYTALLRAVWADYRFEALAWKGTVEAHRRGADPPQVLPDVLAPAIARWSEAVDAVKGYMLRGVRTADTAATVPAEERRQRGLAGIRRTFKAMAEEERDVLRRTLGLDEWTSFDDTSRINQWVDLLIIPLLREWGKFEALEGGAVEVLQETVMQPSKRRTRLFKGKK